MVKFSKSLDFVKPVQVTIFHNHLRYHNKMLIYIPGQEKVTVQERFDSFIRIHLTHNEDFIKSVFVEVQTPTKNVPAGDISRGPKLISITLWKKLSLLQMHVLKTNYVY